MMLFQKLTQRNLGKIKKFPIDFDQGAPLLSSRAAAPVSKRILIKTTENEPLSGVVTFYAMKSGAPGSSRPAG